MKKQIIFFGILLMLSLWFFGIASGQQKMIQIGVVQFASHPALDAAREGFVDVLAQAGFKDGEKIKLDLQNAQRDMSVARTIAKKVCCGREGSHLRDCDPCFSSRGQGDKHHPDHL